MTLPATQTKPQPHYLDEQKAQALIMLQEGMTIYQVAAAVHCSPSTVWRWEQRFRAVDQSIDAPLLMDDWTRIARRSQQKMHDMLDYLDEHPEDIAKHALIPNIYAGTGTDKIQKQREVSQPQNLAQLVIVINQAQPPDYIEGEVKDA